MPATPVSGGGWVEIRGAVDVTHPAPGQAVQLTLTLHNHGAAWSGFQACLSRLDGGRLSDAVAAVALDASGVSGLAHVQHAGAYLTHGDAIVSLLAGDAAATFPETVELRVTLTMAPRVVPPFALTLDEIVLGWDRNDPGIARSVSGFPITLTITPSDMQPNPRMPADLNWDGVVDGLDAAELAAGQAQQLLHCDMDRDGAVSWRDVFLFTLYWTERDSGAPTRFGNLTGSR